MKKNPLITRCPVTDTPLIVTKLYSEKADLSIEGYFELSKFNYLGTDKLYFIEIFMKNRGNIKAIEKELNISYPTVKKYLDEVVTALGYQLAEEEDTDSKTSSTMTRSDILKLVEIGKLSAEEALEALKRI